MADLEWQLHTFLSDHTDTSNVLDFFSMDLTDVQLGFFVVGIQSELPYERMTTLKALIRDAIDRFATTARPLSTNEHLEKLFAYVNNQAKQSFTAEDFSKLHIGIIYYRNNEIQFSMHGDLKLMLIRKSRMFDVIKMTYGLSPHSYDKLFSRMYSGDIKTQDALLFTTAETWDCFDQEKLGGIVSKLPIESTLGFIHNFFPPSSNYRLGGALILYGEQPKQDVKPPHHASTPSESISELLKTEDTTSSWLSPTALERMKKIATGFATTLQERRKNPQQKEPKGLFAKRPTDNIRGARQFVKSFTSTTKRGTGALLQAARSTSKSRTPKERESVPIKRNKILRSKTSKKDHTTLSSRRKIKPVLSIKYSLSRLKKAYGKWPATTKWLLLAAVILVIIFAQSISYINKNQAQEAAQTQFEQLVSTIESLHTQANQAVIFKDYARARSLLIDANNQITELPTATDEQITRKQTLLDENERMLSRANRLTVIPLPFELTNFNNIASAEPNDTVVLNGAVYVSIDNRLLAINPTDGNTEGIELPDTIEVLQGLILDDSAGANEIILLHDDASLTSYNPTTNDFTLLNNTIVVTPEAIADTITFGSRLYRLDAANNQIWRHLKSGNNFQAATPWLTLPSDLSQAKSLAIDGTVYVIDANIEGTISQYEQGVRTEWSAETLEPSIAGATKIYTNENTDFLYVLDPAHNRFLVFDKEGFFLQQFTSPEFNNLKDFVIVEQNNQQTAYLLNGKRIFVVQFNLDL